MKNIISSGLCLFLLTACSGSPSIDDLVNDEQLMTEIQLAAQTSNPNTGILPIALDVASLHKSDLISDDSADKIRSLTHCLNLSGVELIYTKGKMTHIDVNPSICIEQA